MNWDWLFPSGLFTESFMVHAFVSGAVVAVIAAAVGYFVLLRQALFAAHALPKVGFAGAAGAVWLGLNPMLGLTTFTVGGALVMGWLTKNGRRDVVTALILVAALGTGALFLVLSGLYATGAYTLLFGQLVGISQPQVYATLLLGVVCLVMLVCLYRPLLFSSISKDTAEARGLPVRWLELAFLLLVGMATAVTVPVVGALLSFSLMMGPASTAVHLTHHPGRALAGAVLMAWFTVWLALVLAYDTGLPVGFFVAVISALIYGGARCFAALRDAVLERRWRSA